MRKIILIIGILLLSLGKSASARMTMNDLTSDFQHLDKAEIVSNWEWLIGKGKQPILITASGDAFLQDLNDSSIHFLDVVAGELSLVTKSFVEFQTLLLNKKFVTEYFFVQMIGELKQAGVNLKKGQVYSFKVPLVLGGKYETDNVEVTHIYAHFSINGQIHKQVKNLPSGTKIDKIKLEH